jgi:hypothetical protein
MHEQQKPAPGSPEQQPAPPRRRSGLARKVALIGTGLVAGAALAGTVSAQAATTSSSPTPTATSSTPAQPGGGGQSGGTALAPGGSLSLTGTVTAVGTSTVTIKTASGTTAYTVTSSSDIDKNGEATLSALTVGDTVSFSTTATGGTVIDKLHAGNQQLDWPQGAPGGSGQGGSGTSGQQG